MLISFGKTVKGHKLYTLMHCPTKRKPWKTACHINPHVISFEYNNGPTYTHVAYRRYNIHNIPTDNCYSVAVDLKLYNLYQTDNVSLPIFPFLLYHIYSPIVEEMYFMFIASTGKVLFPLWKHRSERKPATQTHIYVTHTCYYRYTLYAFSLWFFLSAFYTDFNFIHGSRYKTNQIMCIHKKTKDINRF